MKRRIYINSGKQNVPNIFTPVKLALPRNKPILNGYEFDGEESDFKEKFNNFNDYLISPSIEGVYETKIPGLFQMIKDYGCSIKFKNKRILDKSISKFEFNLEDFESKGAIDNNKGYDKIYFYYSTLGSRHFIALFFTERKKAFVTLVNTIHKNIEKPNIKKMILNCVNRKFERNEDVDINEGIAQGDYEIVTTIEQDIKVAMKNLNKILYDYRYSPGYHNDTPSIPLIVFQSVLPVDKLSLLGFTSIATDFPIMTLQFNAEENNFPAGDWIRYGVDNLATHGIDLDGIYEFRSQLSNYCNIPKCNIEEDAMLFCTDLIFSRVLKASKQILWYCPSGFPDLGGGDGNHDFLGQIDNKFPSICNPGGYLGYVVEIDIGRFCVNAILQSEHMKDFSGKYELGHVDNFNKNINDKALSNTTFVNLKKGDEYKLERDEFAGGSNAFVVIKKMTEKWLDDVVQYENGSADHLLVHFYRWIASFNSKFYDPVIYRMINLLMQKYFSILVSKVTALEYEIIYGDNKKLILFKKRSNGNIFQTDIEDGGIANIKKIPIFNHGDLTVNQYWKMGGFKDLFNYAGVYVHDEDLNDMGNDITIPRKIASKWTGSKFLPSVLEKDFISIISDYMGKLYNFFYVKDEEMVSSGISLYTNTNFDISKAKEMGECLTPNVLVDATGTADNSIENKRDVIAEFKTFGVNNYGSIKMFNIIPNIMLKRQSYKDEDYDYDIDNDIDNSNPEYGNNENKAKASGYGNVYTRADFGDDSEEYSDFDEYGNENNEDNNDYDDATNYKQIVKSKKPNNKKESKDTTNQNKPQINKPKKQSIWDYPVRLGTYDLASRTNIAIEYINDICEILSLDKSIVTDAILGKRNCLKLVNVEEYSKETIFKDPCRTFTLYDIICESCSNNIDIDFCRDDEILKKEWRCEKCDEHLDKNMIEYLIIRKIQGIIDYYYNQDGECKRCTNQKNEFLFNLCSCAGEYKKTFDENFLGNYSNIDSITDFGRLIKDISVYYEFNMLKMIIDEFV